MSAWETLDENSGAWGCITTDRMPVPGGLIYRTLWDRKDSGVYFGGTVEAEELRDRPPGQSVCMVFVPCEGEA